MASHETPPKKSFAQQEIPFFIGAWKALNYATGFAATVAAIPVDLGIDAVRAVRWATGHRSPAVEGQEGIGCFPLTGEVAAHMEKVGRTIDLIALLGMCAYGTLLIAPGGGGSAPVEATSTPHVYVTPTPLNTEQPEGVNTPQTVNPVNPTATPSWSRCVTIGTGKGEETTAYGAWVDLGKPGTLVFRNLGGPDADNSSSTVSSSALPRIVHKKDALCR